MPTNRESYGGSETAVGKVSARRIPPRCVFFCKSIIEDLPKHNSAENYDTKQDTPGLDAPFRELSDGGFGMSVAISVCWQINFLRGGFWRPIQLYTVLEQIKNTRGEPLKIRGHSPAGTSYKTLYDLATKVSVISTKKDSEGTQTTGKSEFTFTHA